MNRLESPNGKSIVNNFNEMTEDLTSQAEQQRNQTSKFKANYDKSDIRPTTKRYIILLLFCLLSMINAAQWIYLASISDTVSKYYNVTSVTVNWTSMVYMLSYVPLILPASWLFEQIGMRNSIILASMGTSLGSLIKCFGCYPAGFHILMMGQTVVAISQLFILSVPPRLASVWFPDNQVSSATACGVFGNQVGIALGFIVPQMVIGNNIHSTKEIESGLFELYAEICAASSLITVCILFLFDETPLKPPGLARLQQIQQEISATPTGTSLLNPESSKRCGFKSLLIDLITDRNFALLIISYGLNVGVFYAISTSLNQMLVPKWPDGNNLVARLGLLMVLCGMLGSIISGYILDKTRMYRLINVALYSLTFLSMTSFTIAIESFNTITMYITVALLGYFMTSYLFIGYEISNEITWPRPESVTASLLNMSAQVFGSILTYAGGSIVESKGNLTANLFFTFFVLLGLLVTLFIKTQLRRQKAIIP